MSDSEISDNSQPPENPAPEETSSDTGAAAEGTVPQRDSVSRTAPTRARRSRPVIPVALLALGALALWASSRMTWVTLRSSDGLTEPRTQNLNGGVWFGALTPLALVLVAAIAAVFATRGWLLRLVGVLIALVAAVAAVPGLSVATKHGKFAERAAKLAELPARAHVDQALTSTFPAVVCVVGAVAAFGAGVLLARMPEKSAQLSGKYDNPVFRRAAAAQQVAGQRPGAKTEPAPENAPKTAPKADSEPGELSQRVLWDALDAGTDPTDDEPKR
ncbi:MAG: TIGR02234 family membrane protein [Nocardia sp.]|nr:TIGR02234 family membrane protein [Nocardia sp.]